MKANAGCQPSRLGAKHLRLISEQLGIPEWGWPSTLNVTGKWYLIGKPEHLQSSGFVPFQKSIALCPFCDSELLEGADNVMTPLRCPHCERVGWIYDEHMDADRHWEEYQQKARESGIAVPKRRWDELGIPIEVFV